MYILFAIQDDGRKVIHQKYIMQIYRISKIIVYVKERHSIYLYLALQNSTKVDLKEPFFPNQFCSVCCSISILLFSHSKELCCIPHQNRGGGGRVESTTNV